MYAIKANRLFRLLLVFYVHDITTTTAATITTKK